MNEIIELDWYKDYGIKIIPSVKSGEAYSTVSGFEIDEDWGRMLELKKNYKAIYHKTFAVLFQDIHRVVPLDKAIIEKFVENIEKLYLLQLLDVPVSFHWERFVKPEGVTCSTITHELIEDIADMNLDKLFNKKMENKDIYYFQRVKWTINDNQVRARFNFLVLDKT